MNKIKSIQENGIKFLSWLVKIGEGWKYDKKEERESLYNIYVETTITEKMFIDFSVLAERKGLTREQLLRMLILRELSVWNKPALQKILKQKDEDYEIV